MPTSVAQTARIFEDPETCSPNKGHKSTTSVGDVFRGRRKENEKPRSSREDAKSPLGERPINSPPQTRRVPLRDEGGARPTMHKKSGSTTSIKTFLFGREKQNDKENDKDDKDETLAKPKKSKSSTNLSGLLRKRSKKDLRADGKDTGLHTSASPGKVSTPIWAQFATQPVETADGTRQWPDNVARLAGDTPALTPQMYQEDQAAGSHSYFNIDPELRMPQRPYLQKKGSKSSIFTEDLDDRRSMDHERPPSRGSSARPEVHRQQSALSQCDTVDHLQGEKKEEKVRPRSRVFDIMGAFGTKSKEPENEDRSTATNPILESQDLDLAFENVLGRYDIPHNLRDHMRNLKPEVKASLVKGERIGSGSSNGDPAMSPCKRSEEMERPRSHDGEKKRSRSRSRPRSRVFSISRKNKDSVPDKVEGSARSRSKSRPKSQDMSSRPLSMVSNASATSLASLAPTDSASTPGDFIHYLTEVRKPELVEVGKIHKLRISLRVESVQWTDSFVCRGGMDELVSLLHRIMKIEWREDHEDSLLHEILLCLKALSTTKLAMQRLADMESDLLPALLKMLFDPERKGPAEFSTRSLVIQLVFAHLQATIDEEPRRHEERARQVAELMRDSVTDRTQQPLDFVSQMHTSRPYRTWCKEVTNVTKEVFWIFLHHMTVIPLTEPNKADTVFARRYFPSLRAPHPAAPYVGGVEWEATQYLACHLDLLNGLIASLPRREERNQLRGELRQSGFEKVMGISLRTCKEKFYSAVHDGLRLWVAAAKADDWPVEDVRAGPPRETIRGTKSPVKTKVDEAPQIKLDVGTKSGNNVDDGWL